MASVVYVIYENTMVVFDNLYEYGSTGAARRSVSARTMQSVFFLFAHVFTLIPPYTRPFIAFLDKWNNGEPGIKVTKECYREYCFACATVA